LVDRSSRTRSATALLTRRPERQLLPYAVTNRRLLIAWSPLEQGLLSGKYGIGTAPRFDRPSTEYFSPENLRRALRDRAERISDGE
jgi:aryl-alcohol dehydrogenase-like predicted oxidoreductase